MVEHRRRSSKRGGDSGDRYLYRLSRPLHVPTSGRDPEKRRGDGEETCVARDALEHARAAAKASLDENQRATDLSLRAWVMAGRIKPVNVSAELGATVALLRVRNYGKSPAVRWSRSHRFVVTHRGQNAFTGPIPDAFEPKHGFSIAPGAQLTTPLLLLGDGITEEQIVAVHDGTAFLWLVVRCAYVDTTGSRGSSVDAWRYVPAHGDKPARFRRWWIPGCGDW